MLSLEHETKTKPERLLIYENREEIERVLSEAKKRAHLLNTILGLSIKQSQIEEITSSPDRIENYIQQQLLQSNKEYARLLKAGIKAEVGLPESLQFVKNILEAFASINVRYGRYWLLQFDDDTNHFRIDLESAEQYFKQQQYKIFVEGENLIEFMALQSVASYLNQKAQPNQVFSSPFLDQRFTCDVVRACNALPVAKFMVKHSYFREH